MHTPEQAKALWCPMARIARDESIRIEAQAVGGMVCVQEERHVVGGCNTDALGGVRVPRSCRCIADDCAMWRWEHTTAMVAVVHDRDGGKPFTTYEQKTVRTHGYCGLAGNPVGAV